MSTNGGDEKREEEFNFEDDDDEEALSLCDLPVIVIKGENQSSYEAQAPETQEDFEFGSWGGSLLTESEMCVADDVFFKGQILPLRLSISSDNGLPRIQQEKCASRSESMEHCSSGGFSTRSSSSRSHYSSSSTSSTSTIKYKPRIRNQFHTHPSPKPQIRISSARPSKINVRNRKSTMWSFFRLGPVRTPEIELRDLKLRKNNMSCSTSSGSSSNNYGKSSSGDEVVKLEKKRISERFLDKSGLRWSNCKCSVDAVETISSRSVINKSTSNDSSNNGKGINSSDGKKKVNGKQVRESEVKEENQKQQQKQGRIVMSHRRTFEWLKELSIADELAETNP